MKYASRAIDSVSPTKVPSAAKAGLEGKHIWHG